MKIAAVIFDMDGLMLDTEPLYRHAWQQAAIECGRTVSDALYSRLIGLRTEDAERILRAEFGPDFQFDAYRATYLRWEKKIFSAAPPPKKPGLDELLAFLESRQIPKAVATSTYRELAEPRLVSTGLLPRFSALVTGDEAANGKPAPDLFLLAARRLRAEPSACLVLEDAEPGVLAARAASMQVYFVPDMNPPTAKVKELAAAIFDSLFAVAGHLEASPISLAEPGPRRIS